MIQVIDTGNVKTIMNNGLRMFDIEFSYAYDGAQRKRATQLLEAMVSAHNAEEINAGIEANKALNASENSILRFTKNDD